MDSASPKIADCAFIECERFPIYQRSLDSFPDYSGNAFIDNAYRGVLLASGTIEQSGTWQNPGIPYVISMFGGVGLLKLRGVGSVGRVLCRHGLGHESRLTSGGFAVRHEQARRTSARVCVAQRVAAPWGVGDPLGPGIHRFGNPTGEQ